MTKNTIHVVVREDADYDYGTTILIKAFISLEKAEEYQKRLEIMIFNHTAFYKKKLEEETENYQLKLDWNRKYHSLRDCNGIVVYELELI